MATKQSTERQPFWTATRKDFKVDWFSGQGAGGQHRNKHQNCCRITHIPSGLMAVGQDSRERSSNQRMAFNRLADKLIEHYKLREKPTRDISNETIRTYHAPRNVVKDHASGFTQEFKDVVLDGEIADMIEARKREFMKDD